MITCPRCRTLQPASKINTGLLGPCPGCGTQIRADVYDALTHRGEKEVTAENILVQGDAECFEHPGNRAVTACDACGRLLCDLCRVDFDDRNLCMRCLQSARDKKKIDTLQNRRILNDAIALHLSFWPIPTIFLTLFTAPAAVFFAIRHWRTPSSVLGKPVARNILALLLAAGQIAGWIIFFTLHFRKML